MVTRTTGHGWPVPEGWLTIDEALEQIPLKRCSVITRARKGVQKGLPGYRRLGDTSTSPYLISREEVERIAAMWR